MRQEEMMTPWSSYSERLREVHGPYADYLAWEAWMDEISNMPCVTGCDDNCIACRIYQFWDQLDSLDRGNLYGMMSKKFQPPEESA